MADFVKANIQYSTILRIQKITNSPITRGFDKNINQILDLYEQKTKESCPRCNKLKELFSK